MATHRALVSLESWLRKEVGDEESAAEPPAAAAPPPAAASSVGSADAAAGTDDDVGASTATSHAALVSAMEGAGLIDAKGAQTLTRLFVRRNPRLLNAWADATTVYPAEHIARAVSSSADALPALLAMPPDSAEMTAALAALSEPPAAGDEAQRAALAGAPGAKLSPGAALVVLSVHTLVLSYLATLGEADVGEVLGGGGAAGDGGGASDGDAGDADAEDDGADEAGDSAPAAAAADDDLTPLERQTSLLRSLIRTDLLSVEQAAALLYILEAAKGSGGALQPAAAADGSGNAAPALAARLAAMVETALNALLGPLSAPPSASSSDAALDVLQAAVAALRRLAEVAQQLLPAVAAAAQRDDEARAADMPPLPASTNASPMKM